MNIEATRKSGFFILKFFLLLIFLLIISLCIEQYVILAHQKFNF